MTHKTWTAAVICSAAAALLICGALVVIVDPFFHFREPSGTVQYPMTNDAYQTAGILRNFDYDAVMIGSSMVRNFKTSEIDTLFSCKTVKTPLSAARFRDFPDILHTAFVKGSPRIIFWGFVAFLLAEGPDYTERNLPEYLYNDSGFDDVNYILNKDVLIQSAYALYYTASGRMTPSFDEYDRYDGDYTFSKATALSTYTRKEKREDMLYFESYVVNTRETMYQRVMPAIKYRPETEYYIFFPPYSILRWDHSMQYGLFEAEMTLLRECMEELLTQDNVKLYSFLAVSDIVCDLDRYMDEVHHDAEVNSFMLECMANGEYRVTKDNYLDEIERIRDMVGNYDFDALFEED